MKSIKEVVAELREQGELDEEKLANYLRKKIYANIAKIILIPTSIWLAYSFRGDYWANYVLQAVMIIFVLAIIRSFFVSDKREQRLLSTINLGEKVTGTVTKMTRRYYDGPRAGAVTLEYDYTYNDKSYHSIITLNVHEINSTPQQEDSIGVMLLADEPESSTILTQKLKKKYLIKK